MNKSDSSSTLSDHVEPDPNQPDPGTYESPRIERILTPEDMEREVMFAGPAVTIGDVPG
jgi:hypothetical protein